MLAPRVGAVPIPVNPFYEAAEYGYFVADSGATVAVVDSACAEKVEALAKRYNITRWTTDLDAALADKNDTMFFDAASALRKVIGPSNLPSEFFGSQAVPPLDSASHASGASLMMVEGVMPFSSAAE